MYKPNALLTALFVLGLTTISTAQTLPSYLPTDGLVGWWPFNGNANDESGNGNHGTVNGATLTSDRLENPNSSYYFNGINAYISMGDVTFLDGSTSATWNFWISTEDPLPHSIGNDYVSVFRKNLAWIPLQFANDDYDYFRSIVWTNSTTANLIWGGSASGIIPFDNTWVMYTVVKTSTQIKFYKNATYQGFVGDEDPLQNSSEPLIFGAGYTFGGEEYNGKIDEASIYNRALTPEEITALYTATPTNGGGGNTASSNVPQGISYQAVARNAQGQPLSNAALQVKFTLLADSLTGAAEYTESHTLETNDLGLFTTAFGTGTPLSGTFAGINWAGGNKYLLVEIDAGVGFIDLGAQQLLSVPYSMRSNTAAKAGTIENAGLPVYSDNAAALAGGLAAGQMYRTATGDLKIVY